MAPQLEMLAQPAAPRAKGVLHPLDPITADEVRTVKQVLADAGYSSPELRFAYVMLREPDHATLDKLATGGMSEIPREISALVLDRAANVTHDFVVDVVGRRVVSERELDTATEGQIPVLDEDYWEVDAICKSDPRYIAAMAKRGVTDMSLVIVKRLTAGVFGYEDEKGNRMIRVLSFLKAEPTHAMYAHPIDGVMADVDLTNHKLLRLVDTGYTHIPMESGDYLAPEVTGPMRTDLKPLHIKQPQGASFTMQDNVVSWQNWEIRIGFNGREGLTLHDISFQDRGRKRKILNRASVSEMVVPYGEPSPTHDWQNYFDAGEYQFGRLANSLVLGCDCLGSIQYLDATVVDDFGDPFVIKNVVCMHEEDYGTLWKHTDTLASPPTGTVRRQRRFVVSFFVTVGNYDYGFYWHFYLDGKIELECKATGLVFTTGRPEGDYPYATEMAPRLGAPSHQHLFSARLDVAIDGNRCHVDELEAKGLEINPENPRGNAFIRTSQRLKTESEAQRLCAMDKHRMWRIASSEATNRLGRSTGYALMPEGQPVLLAAKNSSIWKRANFASKHLWVTQYARDEMWAAGYAPNQHPGFAGLPTYVKGDRKIDGEDIVVWHTFGLTHFPRIEDWPIMPTDYAGFKLIPEGFFDRNPTLDVPEDPNGKASSELHGCCHTQAP